MVKKRIQVCEYCNNDIDTHKDKFVLLGTYSGKKTDGESYFHFDCFKQMFEERTKEKAKNIVNSIAKNIVPKAKKVMSQVAGVDLDKEVRVDF